MRKWPGLSETAVHVHHNVWWDLSGNPAKGPRTSLWRQFSVVMTPMQASSGWGISVCGHLNSSVTCGPVVPSQVVCSAVFLPYLNYIFIFLLKNLAHKGLIFQHIKVQDSPPGPLVFLQSLEMWPDWPHWKQERLSETMVMAIGFHKVLNIKVYLMVMANETRQIWGIW